MPPRTSLPSMLLVLLAGFGAAPGALAQDPPAPRAATMRGRVIDPDGRPLAGVAVRFCAERTPLDARTRSDPSARTDDQGRFAFPVEPPDDKWRDAMLHLVHAGRASVLHRAAPDYDRQQERYAAEKDFGDLVVVPGTRLFGRVRDDQGRALAGARVVARDVLDGTRGFRGPSLGLHCAVLTDASGIFDLPATVAQGVRLEVSLDSHFSRSLAPVSVGSPLEVTLSPSGQVVGRLLEQDGRGVPDAVVAAAYEMRGESDSVRTGPDGSFRFTRARPGRYRIFATATGERGSRTARSEVLDGPVGNLELYLEPPAGDAEAAPTLLLRVTAAGSGQRVPRFRAVAVFEPYANQNANYLDHRLRQLIRSGREGTDGEVVLEMPSKRSTETGAVRVLAPGFAPATVRDVEHKPAEAGAEPPAVAVELQPESTLSGRVLDEATGAPVAGARIWARPQQDRSMGYYTEASDVPPEAVTSADDGSYTVPMLGEGGHEVHLRHPDRPNPTPVLVDLGRAERRAGFDLPIAAGAVVAGRLTGAQPGPGWKVFLQELAAFAPYGGASGIARLISGAGAEPAGAIAVGEDGSFRFQGMKLTDYRLVLLVPSPPRCGGAVYVPLEPFRLRAEGLQREFDVSRDRPGVVQGRITFPHAGVPTERLVVTARPVSDDQAAVFFNPLQADWSGPRAFVDRDGGYRLPLGPGRYALELVDLATGMRLGTSELPVALQSGGTATCDLAPRLCEIAVELRPPAQSPAAVVDRLEIRATPKEQKARALFGGNDQHDFGMGLDLQPGQTEARVTVPPSDVVLLLRSNVAALRIDGQRHLQTALARVELEAADPAGKPLAATLELPAPPEIPAADEPKAEGKQDADK